MIAQAHNELVCVFYHPGMQIALLGMALQDLFRGMVGNIIFIECLQCDHSRLSAYPWHSSLKRSSRPHGLRAYNFWCALSSGLFCRWYAFPGCMGVPGLSEHIRPHRTYYSTSCIYTLTSCTCMPIMFSRALATSSWMAAPTATTSQPL